MSKLEIGYGHNTFAYLEGCAKCGKPYHPDANWRTTYTAAKESNMVIWLLFLRGLLGELAGGER